MFCSYKHAASEDGETNRGRISGRLNTVASSLPPPPPPSVVFNTARVIGVTLLCARGGGGPLLPRAATLSRVVLFRFCFTRAFYAYTCFLTETVRESVSESRSRRSSRRRNQPENARRPMSRPPFWIAPVRLRARTDDRKICQRRDQNDGPDGAEMEAEAAGLPFVERSELRELWRARSVSADGNRSRRSSV